MSNISFNLSGKLDQDTIDVLLAIKEAADSLGIATTQLHTERPRI